MFAQSRITQAFLPSGRALGTGGEAPPNPTRPGRDGAVVKLGDLVIILDLHRQWLSISAIAGSWVRPTSTSHARQVGAFKQHVVLKSAWRPPKSTRPSTGSAMPGTFGLTGRLGGGDRPRDRVDWLGRHRATALAAVRQTTTSSGRSGTRHRSRHGRGTGRGSRFRPKCMEGWYAPEPPHKTQAPNQLGPIIGGGGSRITVICGRC